MLARHRHALVFAASLSACAAETDIDAPAPDSEPTLAQFHGATTRLLMLVSSSGGVTRAAPVILSAPVASETPAWSTAIRLVCNDCTRGLGAFGYSAQDALFATQYQDEEALRADNHLAADVALVDLPLEATSAEPAVLTAFRVVDASEAADPRYLVRLRIAPDTLYTTTCENFLRAAQGSLDTVPISKRLLSYWALPKNLPTIGCSSIGGKDLPAPKAAEFATPPSNERTTIEAVWTVTRPGPIPGSSAYPYVVTKDGTGKRRGFVIDCSSDARAALLSLGVKFEDIVTTPASDKDLAATDFGKQPVLRCGGIAGGGVSEISSSNDTTKTKRFKFSGQRDLVAFTCRESEAYWSKQKTESIDDVPYQALRYLSAFDGSGEDTRVFSVGCRVTDPCVENPASCKPPEQKPPEQKPPEEPKPPAAWPPSTSPLKRASASYGCVYVQWCDLPNHTAGAVCRTYAGCALDTAAINECRNDTRTTCGTPKTPFWFCNEASTNCKQL